MEVCAPSNSSAFQDTSTKSGPSTDPINHTQFTPKDLSMNDLEACFTQYLKFEDDADISTMGCNLSPKKKDIVKAPTEDGSRDTNKTKSSNLAPEKCICNSATFPLPGEPKSFAQGLLSGKNQQENDKTANVLEESDTAKYANRSRYQSVSLPTPLKLVSAVKGSREKQGIAPKKLSVTWAPDVYDPTPTSVSHVPSDKNHRNRNDGKKYGKNKQKGGGKSSRGKNKEKKQHRKTTVVPVR